MTCQKIMLTVLLDIYYFDIPSIYRSELSRVFHFMHVILRALRRLLLETKYIISLFSNVYVRTRISNATL